MKSIPKIKLEKILHIKNEIKDGAIPIKGEL